MGRFAELGSRIVEGGRIIGIGSMGRNFVWKDTRIPCFSRAHIHGAIHDNSSLPTFAVYRIIRS